MTFDASLAGFDRDIARADATWRGWALRLHSGTKSARLEEPLLAYHHVAGGRAYATASAFAPNAADAPWKDAVLRWIATLTQRRVGHAGQVAWVEAADERRARLPIAPFEEASYHDAWRDALRAEEPVKVAAHLDAAAQVGPELAGIAREVAERRTEVARRLGLRHPLAPWTSMGADDVQTAAFALLRATADLWKSVSRKAHQDGRHTAAEGLLAMKATDAADGWPARLTRRWLEDLFADFARGLRVEVNVPEALGAASFARALAAFGHGLRTAGPSGALPFTLARDPHPVDAHRFGFVFASLPASIPFQSRCLRNVRRVSDAQARRLGVSALSEARAIAGRVILTDDRERIRPDLFEDLTAQLFGGPLPSGLAGAWPRARGDEGVRLVALLTTLPLLDELVGLFDDDWFANPRAVTYLRSRASAPAVSPSDADAIPDSTVTRLAKRFEEALG